MWKLKSLRYFLLFLICAGSVSAQDIPLPLLESDRKSCKASCVQSYSGKQCTALCDCTVAAFKKQVNFDRYLQLVSQVSQNKLSKSNSELMNDIALKCSKSVYATGEQTVPLKIPEKPIS